MNKIFLPLFCMFFFCGVSAQFNTIEIDVEINNYCINEYVNSKNVFEGCSIWSLRNVLILDGNGNILDEKSFWSKGINGNFNMKAKFKIRKELDWFILKYGNKKHRYTDTVSLEGMKYKKIIIDFNKEETKTILQNELFINQMQEGDSLIILFHEYGCNFTNSKIIIKKNEESNQIRIEEISNGIRTNFFKKELSYKDLKILEHFEYDSFRSFLNNCNDIGNSYGFHFSDKKRICQDNCGEWNGYFLLKEGIFNN